MNLTIKYYQGIFIRYATLLAIFMVLRWAFYIYNQSLFSVHSFSEVINVFTGGLIYDFSTLMYSNIILIFLEVFPFPLVKFSVVRKTHRILFTFVNGILLSLICADIVFYQFNGKRIDLELIGLLGAIPALIGSFINEFWYIFILFSILIYFLFRLSKIHTDITSLPKLWVRILVFILSIGIAIIGMRGGVTNKRPLSTASASLHASMENISLVTNSAFTFFYSLANRNIEIPNYIEKQNLENVFPVEITYSNDSSGSQKPNIVLLIMESFSRSVVGSFSGNTSHTPYLDSIANKSTKYVNGFANGRRSSQALVSLISGIPALLPEPFMYSPSAGNKINGIPHQLKKIGYQSAFFNGSSKDKLGWERFINQVGFDQYLSKEDYPNPKHDDGEWGIFDHYMFDYLERVLDTTSNPAFYTLFSISSHHPF
ncbi:MAG: LTA synthase family protein, partial [Salibacteraceae bacterium]